ncbi:hypothetical protein JX265_009077 [Neoarthrinium moseri]|uniref:D-arabinitol 2-dehydrogenase [ribulose-forming] n=1 Tax=Neoarthrinium moseri TaxID=1658444 RepID=A0A9Q0AM45_9PEZI|nr:uncharacterized protein JN550_011462 [Neoarthrinium moseri]KAI1860614.1 hypothetical protein JN550_011462 [Neoarthrinium moseri]KAI1863031.1 hypothetical protein JX265_009077 [Neoarthrinium moseri]
MERSELTSRVIPLMNLSTGSSPLTAPIQQNQCLSPEESAANRFRIYGNAVVTGGGGDLGFTACQALLEHGLSGLVIFDLDPVSAASRVADLQAGFPNAKISFATVNVTDADDVERSIDAVVRSLGSVDILLAFAGVASCAHAIEMPAKEWRRVFDINTTGSFLCAQAVAKAQANLGKRGSILFVASISAHRVNFPQPQVAYNASKAAVLATAKSLAAEWARYGIRVNSISPGYMDTILNEGSGLKVARDTWNDRNPMGRMGVPEELCGAIIMLSSQAGSYITGADLCIDGGQTLF